MIDTNAHNEDTSDMSEAELILAEEEREAARARGELDDEEELDEEGKKKKATLPVYPVAEQMAPTTQAEFDEIVKGHGEWMDSVLHPRKDVVGGRANLSGADLRAFDLIGVNLASANLSHANLAGLDLTGANLSAANLVAANLQGVILRGAKLRKAKLTDADLRAVDFTDAQLGDLDLSVAILTTEDYKKRQLAHEKSVEAQVDPTEAANATADQDASGAAKVQETAGETIPDAEEAMLESSESPAMATDEATDFEDSNDDTAPTLH